MPWPVCAGNPSMNITTATLIGSTAAYALGSIPFGYLIARLVAGIDIRDHGSGNIGATNVGRVLGARWGILALVLDFLKGLLPVWLVPIALVSQGDPRLIHVTVACGVATILGHMYPCWLRLRGGKGVATALGVVAWLSPVATLVAFLVFAASFALWRIVSLSSMLAAIGFAICGMWLALPAPFSATQWSLSLFTLAIPALIVLRHRTNLRRLLRGEEKPFHAGRRVPPPSSPDSHLSDSAESARNTEVQAVRERPQDPA